MNRRIPLHTHPSQISDYARIARDLLAELETDVENLAASNEAEDRCYPSDPATFVADRMELASWHGHTTRKLLDVLYLLAVGDHGATEAAAADPERASKQAHWERRQRAIQNLTEQGVLPYDNEVRF